MDLSNAENYYLWVNSGGMCAICKRKLILDDVGKKINIGERAHIIAKGKRGPRREHMEEYGLTEDRLDTPENLILLCETHHKIIDQNPEQYPPHELFRIKKEHEQFVQKRLELYGNSIVVIHKRKGGPIDHISIADQINCLLMDAVSLQEEFNDFSKEGWQEAKKKNEEFYTEVMKVKQKYDGATITVFPLSPIPLLVHFGKLISDTVPVEIYQYDRSKQVWVRSAPRDQEVKELELEVSFSPNESDILVVTIEITSKIRPSDVVTALENKPYKHLNIYIPEPKIDAVLFHHDVKRIKETFQNEILRLRQEHDVNEIHLFYAGPAGLAVELGRCINETMFPYVHLYHFNEREIPRYQYAFTI
ncbi:SAVED domain-containing protein [Geobacillus sp. WSUCF-018B]|uniref:SAVED domain-containing protein n=1 Tax=Geobacillus sp. WSUCF-018B TaxID=2055939 RepID=UPI000C2934E2|nr:SAVED domain-containing protein [Geobacillus sp. WSUCF-018B]PJW18888.1 endonuclease [Geobacillus sp. WSUCF-018B]